MAAPVPILMTLEALEAGEPLAPEARQWLTAGLRAHLAGKPLEAALGLSSPGRGKRKAGTVAALAARDELLRAAGRLFPGSTVTAAARNLQHAISRLERSAKRKSAGSLTEAEKLIEKAASHAPLPGKRRLQSIIGSCNELPYSLHARPGPMELGKSNLRER